MKKIVDIDNIHIKIRAISHLHGADHISRAEHQKNIYDKLMLQLYDLNAIAERAQKLIGEAINDIDTNEFYDGTDIVDSLNEAESLISDIMLNDIEISLESGINIVHNGVLFENILQMVEYIYDVSAPMNFDKTYHYYYTNINYSPPSKSSGYVDKFEQLANVAYSNPTEFSCDDLTDEEKQFIELVIALGVENKLIE